MSPLEYPASRLRRGSRLRSALASALLAAGLLGGCGRSSRPVAPVATPPAESGVVSGTILLPGNTPAASAVVTLERVRSSVPDRARWLWRDAARAARLGPAALAANDSVWVVLTGSDGRFRFSEVPDGDYALTGRTSHHLAAVAHVRIDRAGATPAVTIELLLAPSGTLAGSARLESSAHHAGTVVYLPGTSYVSLTDDAGEYAMHDVPLGSWTATAMHSGYLDGSASGALAGAGDSLRLPDVTLQRDRNLAPIAKASSSCLVGCPACAPITLRATGSVDRDGTIVLWEWDFEDDGVVDWASADSGTVVHSYSATGTHRAKLTVTDDKGAIGVDVVSTTSVNNGIPVAIAATSCTGGCKTGVPISFVSASSFDPDGPLSEVAWDFDDDGIYDAIGPQTTTISHAYPVAGTYVARLRVTDGCGVTASDTASVIVHDNQPPIARVVVTCPNDNHCLVGTTVTFAGATSTDSDGAIMFWSWDLENDGSTEASGPALSSVAHSFTTSGTHSVRLTVTDDNGSQGSTVVPFTVDPGPPPPPVSIDTAFVSVDTGSPLGLGTRQSPLQSITAGFQRLTSINKVVIVAIGSYPESLVVPPQTTLVGGFNPVTWQSIPGARSVVEAGTTGSQVQSISNTTIRQMEFRGAQGIAPGGSSIAMRVRGVNASIQFIDCAFVARAGADGMPGDVLPTPAPSKGGSAGQPGCLDCSTGGAGGARGGGAVYGGVGGLGGYASNGSAGAAGGLGAGSIPGGAGGAGGSIAVDCVTPGAAGNPGGDGQAGAIGANGTIGSSTGHGTIANGSWVSISTNGGALGLNGSGGGGAGGGGGGIDGAGCTADRAAGGGGGGAGGLGGYGGRAGRGGGASIAVLLDGASPTFVNCTFTCGNGGAGGAGSNGTPGGTGGTGGAAGLGAGAGGAGGIGGRGGDGGAGGGGAGGAGGPSWCIYRFGTTTANVTSPTFFIGNGGAGGSGGLRGDGANRGAGGPDGTHGAITP
jgi:PKD repeat protein